MRHSWEKIHSHKWVCKKCKCTKLLIPNPYAREWITEFTFPGEEKSYYGKTPECRGENKKPKQTLCQSLV